MRSSPAADRLTVLDAWFVLRSLFFCAFPFVLCAATAFAQQTPPRAQPAPSATQAPGTQQTNAELASHDEPTTFKVNVKLVLVRAVVRDARGHAIGNLRKEDFQVFDKGKPQTITQFEVEKPGELAARARQTAEEVSPEGIPTGVTSTQPAPAAAERFVVYLFDDVHLVFGDLAQVREAAERHFSTLRPTDRAAIFTTSGFKPLDFTDDHAKLHDALVRLQPRPIVGSSTEQCPDISYYQADLIINKNDSQALQEATQEAEACQPPLPGQSTQSYLAQIASVVQFTSAQALSTGEHESRIALGVVSDAVRALSRMPGQRSVVLVSPGFVTPDLQYDYMAIIDHAVRSQVVINTLDARGLYVPTDFADASRNPGRLVAAGPAAMGLKSLIETAAASAQSDTLAVLADGTGGVFFQNNNDFNEGFRRVAEAPEFSYLLAFVPQDLKLDGKFHTIQVKLVNPQKLSVQARRGYFAPKNFTNPEEQAKQEIEYEMFSQEELHNLPVRLHTQFFKENDTDAKLIVLAHVDVQHLRFRKAEGRNNNVLTCVSALFNRNGNFLQGTEKTVTMRWRDDTLEHKLSSGITLKTSFDVKPGTYMVRLVVRDTEGQLMSAENGTVEIR